MTTVHLLGSGTPTPTPERFGSAFAVEVAGTTIMVDCGPSATGKLVKAGLWPTEVEHLFFTHHHFDHDVDYPCFLLCRWDQGAGMETELRAYGPAPTEGLTTSLIAEDGVFAHDIYARIHAPASQQVFENRGGTLPRRWPTVDSRDIGPGIVHTDVDWEVRAAPAQHVQPYLDSLAYRLDTRDGSVVFTGDTEPCDSVTDLARDADVMLCMCWDVQSEMERVGEARGQCGTIGAGRMAEEAGVDRLVLVHSGPSLNDPSVADPAIEKISSVYSGTVVLANELTSLEL